MVAAKRTVCASNIKRRVDVKLSDSESLLFLHAVSGCDTTSRPHGIGKVGVLKKYAALAESAATFMASESSKVALETAAERALLVMYGSQVDDLKTARLQRFQTKVATCTTREASADIRRRPISQSPCLSPDVRATEPAAPAQLLRNIRCNCGGRCDTRSCTCFKNGLQCTPACGQSKGIVCLNSPRVDREDFDAAADDDI
ncbi:Hypothetical predicted protein [Paramuricea clavata]|uniref:Uncharacterized protein n=1 Tax=Paramuricea clavata TaxID=317549 RepID=A0A6S7I252_PARCT|nr:Hypothetical predicted protein [Paramuricea clavata]